jgi:Kef-type K+ transport system membrane component KefB
MSGYWICHQCGQRVPAGQVEVHNIQHLTRRNTQRNGGASPAEMAAFLTLLFSLIAWVVKTLYKFIVVIFKFCKRRPRLTFEMLIITALGLVLIIPQIHSLSGDKTSTPVSQKVAKSSTKKHSEIKRGSSAGLKKDEIQTNNSLDPVEVVTKMPIEPIAPTPTSLKHFEWPPSATSEVPTQNKTVITGVSWTQVPNNPDWYTYTEPQWQYCGGGSSQCQIIWWVSSKPCLQASPRAEYTLEIGNTQSSSGWHGSSDAFIAVWGNYVLPGNIGGDRSLQSRLATYSAVSISCRS